MQTPSQLRANHSESASPRFTNGSTRIQILRTRPRARARKRGSNSSKKSSGVHVTTGGVGRGWRNECSPANLRARSRARSSLSDRQRRRFFPCRKLRRIGRSEQPSNGSTAKFHFHKRSSDTWRL